MRFPYYLKRLEAGGTKIKPRINRINENIASVLIDGDNGMGQIIGIYAANLAIEKAKGAGISFIGVKRSSHFGAASYYSVKIAEANMIGVSMCNSTSVMATWGGEKKEIIYFLCKIFINSIF